MTEGAEAKCPCCRGKIEYFPDQDGACDYQCIHCGWREHVPGSGDISAALTLRGSRSDSGPAHTPQPQATGGTVDLELLERQAAILGRIVDGGDPTEEERSCLEGLWEFVHTILDGSQTRDIVAESQHVCQNCGSTFPAETELPGPQALEQRVSPGEPVPSGECPKCGALCHLELVGTLVPRATSPTVVVFVDGGAVHSVQGAGARVIVCDFDNVSQEWTVGGRHCSIDTWAAPEKPDSWFEEVLRLPEMASRKA